MTTATAMQSPGVSGAEVLADDVGEVLMGADGIPARSVSVEGDGVVLVGSFDSRREATASMQHLVSVVDAPFDAAGVVFSPGTEVEDPITGDDITHPPVFFVRFRV